MGRARKRCKTTPPPVIINISGTGSPIVNVGCDHVVVRSEARTSSKVVGPESTSQKSLFTSDNENEPLGSNSHLDGVGSPNLSRETPHLKPGLRSNSRRPLIPPLHTLGRCGQVVRVPCIELPDVMWLDANFSEFDYLWGIVMNEYYEPTHGLTFLSVQLYGVFGLHDVPEVVVEWVDENDDVLEVPTQQMWALSGEYPSDNDSDYQPSDQGEEDPLETTNKLTPKTRTWFMESNRADHELGIGYGDFDYLDGLSEKERFAEHMWNSPVSSIPHVEWRGGSKGFKDGLGEFESLEEYLMLFWPLNMMRKIVRMTNLYAGRSNGESGTLGGPKWVYLTVSELKSWFAIVILMGLKKIPNQRLHWSSTDMFHSREISSIMCRRRFEDILRCIHLVDNDHITTNKDEPSYSKIAKCEWLVREHNALYSQYWQPEQNLTIDEMMVKYCGKYSPIRQYMKAKPTQYGIKIWCLANSVSKYVQKMEVYCGKSEECEGEDQNTGYKVVTSLVSGLEHVGHVITCDNWFTSPILFWDLLKLGFRATGTCRTNRRGWPSALTIDKGKAVRAVPRGTMWWRMHASHQMAAVTWLDNKPVTILTTAVSPIDVTNDLFVGRWQPLVQPSGFIESFHELVYHLHQVVANCFLF
jgi:hypothetical protein